MAEGNDGEAAGESCVSDGVPEAKEEDGAEDRADAGEKDRRRPEAMALLVVVRAGGPCRRHVG